MYITEYVRQGNDLNTKVAYFPEEPPIAEQTVAIGAGSVQSAALNVKTRIVRLHADAICSVLFGVNPTATAASRRLAVGQSELITVDGLAPTPLKVAVIQNT